MRIMSRLRSLSRRMQNREDGAVVVEGVIIFSALVWFLVASVQFFHAFRARNVNQKASYTLADLISREVGELDEAYVSGLDDVFDALTGSARPSWIRVTSLYYDETLQKYRVDWSAATGGHAIHTDDTLNAVADRIPNLESGEFVVLTETTTDYVPIFNVGLTPKWFREFIVTRPRFTPRIAWKTGEDGLISGDDGVTDPGPDFFP